MDGHGDMAERLLCAVTRTTQYTLIMVVGLVAALHWGGEERGLALACNQAFHPRLPVLDPMFKLPE